MGGERLLPHFTALSAPAVAGESRADIDPAAVAVCRVVIRVEVQIDERLVGRAVAELDRTGLLLGSSNVAGVECHACTPQRFRAILSASLRLTGCPRPARVVIDLQAILADAGKEHCPEPSVADRKCVGPNLCR